MRILKLHKRKAGFTLIELLIVIAVLGALAAVVVPAVGAFIATANLTASNTEAANVKTAAMSFLADTGGFPANSGELFGGGTDYLSEAPDGTYYFDNTTGQINRADSGEGITKGFRFIVADQVWARPNSP